MDGREQKKLNCEMDRQNRSHTQYKEGPTYIYIFVCDNQSHVDYCSQILHELQCSIQSPAHTTSASARARRTPALQQSSWLQQGHKQPSFQSAQQQAVHHFTTASSSHLLSGVQGLATNLSPT